jgi:hypothetical protein
MPNDWVEVAAGGQRIPRLPLALGMTKLGFMTEHFWARNVMESQAPNDGIIFSAKVILRSSAISRVDARQDGAQEGFEAGLDALAGFHHFLVRERLVENSGGHVGDAGDGEHFDSHVARGDHFEGRRHADQVGADDSQIVNLGGRFVTGSEQGGVDAFVQRHSEFGGFFARDCAIVFWSRRASCRESARRSGRHWRRLADSFLQIDVVADQDQRALLIIQIDASRGIGEDDGANSHASEDAHGEGDLLRRIAFVKMHAALHHGDGTAPALPMTICPAWPMAVERGKAGMSAKGIRVASVSESAKPPRPEPRTNRFADAARFVAGWIAVSARVN